MPTLRQGESLPVYGSQLYKIGETHTIQAIPAPVVTVYKADSTILDDENGTPLQDVAVTGYDADAKQTVRAWWQPSAELTDSLEIGDYTAYFTFETVASDDAITRRYRPSVTLTIIGDEPIEEPEEEEEEEDTDILTSARLQIETLTKSGMDPVLQDDELTYIENIYDTTGNLAAAVAEGWRIKMGAASVLVNTTTGASNNSVQWSQMYDHCKEMYLSWYRRAFPLTVSAPSRGTRS